MSPLEAIVLAGALASVARALRLGLVLASIPRLADREVRRDGLPSVTIACAARDEAAEIERACRSWLAQDVPRLQVIVVDDRSADRTSEILARLAAEDPRLLPLRVDERPAGWLGKCHALSQAAARATGDFILFTDGDVRLAPDCVRRALSVAVDDDADVLALMPDVDCDGPVQRSMTEAFFHFFLITLGGRRVNADDGRSAIGIGAFNLVRRSTYEAVGGHEPIRMQVGDDVGLVRLIQHARGRHRLLSGEGFLRLRWQAGVMGMIRGLEKNFFWGARFSVALVLAFTAGIALLLAPLAAPWAGTPLAWACFAAWLGANAVPYFVRAPREGRAWNVLLHPLAQALLVAAAWNSMIRTLHRGGITWRGDRVGLPELRAALLPWGWWRRRIDSRPSGAPLSRDPSRT